MSTTTANGVPLHFEVRVLHDPEQRLQGQLSAQATEQGLVIDAGDRVVVPTGSPVSYLGRNRLAVKVENREVQLAVKRRFSNQNLLTYDLVAYLNGDINLPEAKTYGLSWLVFVPALLVLGVPLVMWFVLNKAEALETQREVAYVKAVERLDDLHKQKAIESAKALAQGQIGEAAEPMTWHKDLGTVVVALQQLETGGTLKGPALDNALTALKAADLNNGYRTLKEATPWIGSTRDWIFLGSIGVTVLLAGLCLFNAFTEGWKLGRRLLSAGTVVVLGYLMAFGSWFILQQDFSNRTIAMTIVAEEDDTHPAARFKPYQHPGPGLFAVYAVGAPKMDKVTWKITPEDSVQLDTVTWTDASLGITYVVLMGKLPEKWAKDYMTDEKRLETEALQMLPEGSRVSVRRTGELAVNRPKGAAYGVPYPLVEILLEQPSTKEHAVRRVLTIPRTDGTWVYWTLITGEPADPRHARHWTVQYFHNGFQLPDLPSKFPPKGAGGAGGGGGGGVDASNSADAEPPVRRRPRPRPEQGGQNRGGGLGGGLGGGGGGNGLFPGGGRRGDRGGEGRRGDRGGEGRGERPDSTSTAPQNSAPQPPAATSPKPTGTLPGATAPMPSAPQPTAPKATAPGGMGS